MYTKLFFKISNMCFLHIAFLNNSYTLNQNTFCPVFYRINWTNLLFNYQQQNQKITSLFAIKKTIYYTCLSIVVVACV